MAALVVLGIAAAAIVLTMPRLEAGGRTALTSDATPTIELRVANPIGIRADRVAVTIDDERLPARRVTVSQGGELIAVRVPPLEDGDHEVSVVVRDAGLLRSTLRARWTLTVDTTPPAARILAPATTARADSAYAPPGVSVVTTSVLRVAVAAEPGSSLALRSTAPDVERVTLPAERSSRRTAELRLPDGAQTISVVATDDAGNDTRRRLRVLVDTSGPALVVRAPRVLSDATLQLPVSARDPHGVTLEAKLNGRALEPAFQEQSTTPAPYPRRSTDAAPIAGQFTLTLDEPAYEGRHVLEVVATDSLGSRTTVTRRFLVDSTEQLGEAAGLRPGARGADVAMLHEALLKQETTTRARLASELRTRTYGPVTRAAVQSFQRERGMSVDGVAGSDTIAALTLRILIDRAAHRLTLYRLDQVVKSWGIAVGSPQYPTPAGEFEIQTMQKHPTWTPPDSEWARDAEVIPPGPDNPLGTRWMAIAGTVGIHGTNSPASIGYSVSHGCIRMAIPDVEELYDMVSIGTPVTVV